MHEVISIAASQRAGHLLCQLYNVQESHIPYKKKETPIDNNVFLYPVQAHGRTTYYPRSINIELHGGYGLLGKYEYHEKIQRPDNVQVIQTEQVPKHEFQQKLDQGLPADGTILEPAKPKFWTDYSKLLYRPQSLLDIDDYKHPDGEHKFFPNLKFDQFQIGQEQFKGCEDAVEDIFRRELETSDQMQGVQLFTELDTAWGGLTNEMLLFLKDEYFNNGAAKYNIWLFGATSLQKQSTLTRIKSLVELSKSTSLVFPLVLQPDLSSGLLKDFLPESMWHQESLHSVFVNSLWLLSSRRKNQTLMSEMEDDLLRGYDRRNIVNEISLHGKQPFQMTDDPRVIEAVLRGEPIPGQAEMVAELGLHKHQSNQKPGFRRAIITPEEKEEPHATVYKGEPSSITKLDTFPAILQDVPLHTEFGQSGQLRTTLKEYRQIVSRVRAPQQHDILGDKAELIEDICGLIDEYTVGYADDSESEDDY